MRQQCECLALYRSKPFLVCDGIKDFVKLLSKQQHEDSRRRNLKDEGLCPHFASSAGPVEFDGKRRRRVHRPEDYDPFRLYAGVEIGLRLGNIEPERIPVRVYLLRTLDNFCVATRKGVPARYEFRTHRRTRAVRPRPFQRPSPPSCPQPFGGAPRRRRVVWSRAERTSSSWGGPLTSGSLPVR